MTATVEFYGFQSVCDELIKYAVIAARCGGSWIFCRHKSRTTFEIPGGHREPGESITRTAGRELYEETGATDFSVVPICPYSVTNDDGKNYGMLFLAEVTSIGNLPKEFEMAELKFLSASPDNLTYPDIQPVLFGKATEFAALR